AFLVLVLATQLRALFGAAWLGVAVDASLGFRAAVQVLTDALIVDLGWLVIGAAVIWAASRDLGRAFDLACVAVLPLLFVDLAGSVVVYAGDLELPRGLMWLLAGIGYAWTGALLALALVDHTPQRIRVAARRGEAAACDVRRSRAPIRVDQLLARRAGL